MYVLVVESLGFLALVAMAFGGVLAASALLPGGRFPERVVAAAPDGALKVGFLAALLATVGSLYLSEVVGFVPCELCWFQRIAMYPLVIVLGVAVLRGDLEVWRTALPIAGVGLAISIYHAVIQRLPALEVTECSGAVPCSAVYVTVWGFVSIPVMAGSVFLLVSGLLIALATRRGLDDEDVAGDAQEPSGVAVGT